ncbi:MAG: hypothetical protein RLZZ618_1027 [Pseudomonadota bacterium]|jgi:hypothetical protein
MGSRHSIDGTASALLLETSEDSLAPLLVDRSMHAPAAVLPEVVVGELIAITDDGTTPLVRYPGQPGTGALRARAVLDLHAEHLGRSVVLSFERGDAARPIVMGVLRDATPPVSDRPGEMRVDADGERLIVSAKEQLVLQCGKASITLTRSGKVLVQGTYLSSRSTGVNRIKGGTVQLN